MSELQTAAAAKLPGPLTAAAIDVPLALLAVADPASRIRRMRQLEDRGFRVAVARTGFEAIVKASCHVPDLILIDESLGEADAAETTKLLASCPATEHIPVVRVTPGRRLPTQLTAAAR